MPLPLLIVLDGAEFARFSGLPSMLDARGRQRNALPPMRAALCHPTRRDEHYSASPLFAAYLAEKLIAAVEDVGAVAPRRSYRAGLGASLGGLALLHAHRQFARAVRLPVPRVEQLLSRASRGRIGRTSGGSSSFVGDVLAPRTWPHPIDVAMTCGTVERNLANNEECAAALAPRATLRTLRVVPDAHNWIAWRDAWTPHLVGPARHGLALRRDTVVLHSLPLGDSQVIAYGHWGRPVLVFASDSGRAEDFENNGSLGAVAALVDEGRVKILLHRQLRVGQLAAGGPAHSSSGRRSTSASRTSSSTTSSAFILADCARTRQDMLVTGCSFGAYHAANFALRRAELFARAICMSGAYDMSKLGWGERGDAFYFNNPVDYVANLERRPPRVAAQPGPPHPRRRPRALGGRQRQRSALEHACAWRACFDVQSDPARARRLGPRLSPRLAVVATPAGATTSLGTAEAPPGVVGSLSRGPDPRRLRRDRVDDGVVRAGRLEYGQLAVGARALLDDRLGVGDLVAGNRARPRRRPGTRAARPRGSTIGTSA